MATTPPNDAERFQFLCFVSDYPESFESGVFNDLLNNADDTGELQSIQMKRTIDKAIEVCEANNTGKRHENYS